jgi:hypothetical protein
MESMLTNFGFRMGAHVLMPEGFAFYDKARTVLCDFDMPLA